MIDYKLCLYVTLQKDTYYRAVYLNILTLQELKSKLAKVIGLNIDHLFVRSNNKLVLINDDAYSARNTGFGTEKDDA